MHGLGEEDGKGSQTAWADSGFKLASWVSVPSYCSVGLNFLLCKMELITAACFRIVLKLT